MGFFKLKIQTPNKTVVDCKEADQIWVQSMFGPVGLLPKHTHMIFQLDNGIVTAVSDTKENFFIGQGICKIIDDKVTILCPFCKRPEDIDVNREKDLVEKISKKLADKNITLDESEKLHKELQTARQMIQITQKD